MSSQTNTTNGGIGFTGMLAIAFIVLKLCNIISWSWLWVLSPIWVPFGLMLIGFLVYLVFVLLNKNKRSKRTIAIPKWQQRYDEMTKNQKKEHN